MIYKGSVKQKDIYIGSTKIGKVYKGSTLVYQSKLPAGQVIFESATPGTYTITISKTQNYYIELVGGGAGAYAYLTNSNKAGTSASMITGTIQITAGTYELVVGSGARGGTGSSDYAYNCPNGGDTTFLSQKATGGLGHSATNYKNYGNWNYYSIPVVTLSGLVGTNGIATPGTSRTGGVSVYDGNQYGYGAGGVVLNNGHTWYHTDGISGYCKIVAV